MPDNFQILRRSNNIYTALYRKLRPTSFADVVGQEHIIRTLTNQIELGRLSHAYLFCGTRGTGKTTCARVFARAVNCEASVGGEACGVCRPCVDIAAGTSLDVIEIDAASNNGVDNIRDLREEVRYPATGRYKVYIVDEVHMLSAGAFNALLKTLEEPPPHVIFILATTDPQKIPATIHSRLMRFDFHRASQEQMTEALGRFMEGESIAVTSDALAYVARLSDGSWRDALSILDRCAALYYGEEITLAGVLEVTGSVDDGVFFALIESLMGRDAQKCLEIIEEMSAKGRDFGQFVEELLHHLRNMLMEAAKAKDDNYHDIIGLIGIFSELSRGMRHAGGHGRLMLEVACIEHAAGPRVVEVMAVAEPQMAKTHPKQQAKPPEEKP
ncbi:MAG: DNA polymerase III subunit gamma/tau, partial [Defluviitaleaceae bacterium]|nr:DNA polymerase III subunit gamma/tau [Defluviitaleaceae bacterium]